MAFLLAEDEGLKKLFAGMVVSDASNARRNVPVYFGLPDLELRSQTFPFMTIDLVDISEARERVHRGLVELPYRVEGFPVIDPTTTALQVEFPTPIDLMYQVTVWSRNPQHDRQLLSQMLGIRIPFRFGQVTVDEGSTTHDATVRRLDLLGITKRDTLDSDRKRIFRNVFSLRMSSEVLPAFVPELMTRVKTVTVLPFIPSVPTLQNAAY